MDENTYNLTVFVSLLLLGWVRSQIQNYRNS
jgi:hypothetical protein